MWEVKDITVNALGEVFAGTGFEYIAGDINLCNLQQKLGHEPEQHEVDAEFIDQLRSDLTPEAVALVQDVWHVQKLNDGRVRIGCYPRLDGLSPVTLCTEFIAFVDDAEAWTAINAAAAALGIKADPMSESEHLDKVSHDDCKTWVVGKDHGRMERQVSFDLTIDHPSMSAAQPIVERVVRVTQDIWDKYGVAVI